MKKQKEYEGMDNRDNDLFDFDLDDDLVYIDEDTKKEPEPQKETIKIKKTEEKKENPAPKSSGEQNVNNDNGPLTVQSAMGMYFLPKLDSYKKRVERYREQCEEKLKSFPKLQPRKLKWLRIILESLMSVGLGFFTYYCYSLNTPDLYLTNSILAGLIGTCGFGLIIGVADNIIYRIKSKIRLKEARKAFEKYSELLDTDLKYVSKFYESVDAFLKCTDASNYKVLTGLAETQCGLGQVIEDLYRMIANCYEYTEKPVIKELVDKYLSKFSKCYENPTMIMEDLKTLKENVGLLHHVHPEGYYNREQNAIIIKYQNELKDTIAKTLIPFAQIFTAIYDKSVYNYNISKQEEDRKKLEEDKIQNEIKRKDFEEKNKEYKKFFDKFGIDEELDEKDFF